MSTPRGAPTGMTEAEKQAFIRRRRGRNLALLLALLALVVLFYLMALARMQAG